MVLPDHVTCTTAIGTCAQGGQRTQALTLLDDMTQQSYAQWAQARALLDAGSVGDSFVSCDDDTGEDMGTYASNMSWQPKDRWPFKLQQLADRSAALERQVGTMRRLLAQLPSDDDNGFSVAFSALARIEWGRFTRDGLLLLIKTAQGPMMCVFWSDASR